LICWTKSGRDSFAAAGRSYVVNRRCLWPRATQAPQPKMVRSHSPLGMSRRRPYIRAAIRSATPAPLASLPIGPSVGDIRASAGPAITVIHQQTSIHSCCLLHLRPEQDQRDHLQGGWNCHDTFSLSDFSKANLMIHMARSSQAMPVRVAALNASFENLKRTQTTTVPART
jgi:hypothetical protein